MRLQMLALSVFASLGLLASCTEKQEASSPAPSAPAEQARSKPAVYTTNYPTFYFTQRIAGDTANVFFKIPDDIDPAFWEPTPDEVKTLQGADLIITNGATYEKWLNTVTIPDSKIVETALPFKDQWLQVKDAVTHSHGPGGEHSHAGTDFNTWLDPDLAKKQAAEIAEALTEKIPASKDVYTANLVLLNADLDGISKGLDEFAKKLGTEPVIGSHPVYAYFARRYNINYDYVHWEPEEMPSDEQWKEFDAKIAARPGTRIMLWEGVPEKEIADKATEHGVVNVPFLPCGNVPDEGDYIETMKENIERLNEAVKK